MSTLQEIELAIERLSREDLFKLADRISARVSEAWDQQIEEDVLAGRLDALAAKAVAECRTGKLWAAEAKRRLMEIEKGSVSPLPADEVLDSLRQKYSG